MISCRLSRAWPQAHQSRDVLDNASRDDPDDTRGNAQHLFLPSHGLGPWDIIQAALPRHTEEKKGKPWRHRPVLEAWQGPQHTPRITRPSWHHQKRPGAQAASNVPTPRSQGRDAPSVADHALWILHKIVSRPLVSCRPYPPISPQTCLQATRQLPTMLSEFSTNLSPDHSLSLDSPTLAFLAARASRCTHGDAKRVSKKRVSTNWVSTPARG